MSSYKVYGVKGAAAERLEIALDAGAIVGTWVWDINADSIVADERFAASFGIDPERCQTGLPLATVMKSIHPEDRDRVSAEINDVLARGASYRCDYRVRRPDDTYYWVGARGRVERSPDGSPTRFPGVLIDIDQQKRIEDLRQFQNELLELAVTDASLEKLLELLIEAVEARSASGMLGSILLLDTDEQHLTHGAAPSLPKAYCDAIDGIAIGPKVGSCGTAAHRKKPVFVADIASDPLWENYKDLALSHGLCACWSIPLFTSDRQLLGTFADIRLGRPWVPTRSQSDLQLSQSAFARETPKTRSSAGLGPLWGSRLVSRRLGPSPLQDNAFASRCHCLRNDGVTGSSPVSGTTTSTKQNGRSHLKVR